MTEPASAISSGKWQERFGRQAPTSTAAARGLKRRLEAMQSLLDAINRAGAASVEEIHQLRVASRRTTAALDLYKDFLPAKARAALRALLKTIRRAASEARRADVQKQAFDEANRPAILEHLDR